jgi:hypothetical protein
VFSLIAQHGRVERLEMEKTFNMGVGMVAVVASEDADRVLAVLTARHVPAWVLGEVSKAGEDEPRAELVANGLDLDGIRRSIGADSLGYVSLDGLVAASEQPAAGCARRASTATTPSRSPRRRRSASICSNGRSLARHRTTNQRHPLKQPR